MNTHKEQYMNKLELVKFIRSLSPTREWAKAIEDGLVDTLTFVVEFCQATKKFDVPLPSPYSKEWCYLVYRVVEAMRRDDELRDNGQMKFCEEDDNNTIAHLIEHYIDQVQRRVLR
jgi:hypothetical protein